MGFGRYLTRYVATGAIIFLGFRVIDHLGYTPMIKQGFNTAASGISSLIKDATGKNVKLDEIVDVDELIATAENVRSQIPEGQSVNVNSSIDGLISLVDNLSLNDIPAEYVPQIKEVLSTSTGALEDMNINLDNVSFDSALDMLNSSIDKLQSIESDMDIIEYDAGTYDNYGTYY